MTTKHMTTERNVSRT